MNQKRTSGYCRLLTGMLMFLCGLEKATCFALGLKRYYLRILVDFSLAKQILVDN